METPRFESETRVQCVLIRPWPALVPFTEGFRSVVNPCSGGGALWWVRNLSEPTLFFQPFWSHYLRFRDGSGA